MSSDEKVEQCSHSPLEMEYIEFIMGWDLYICRICSEKHGCPYYVWR